MLGALFATPEEVARVEEELLRVGPSADVRAMVAPKSVRDLVVAKRAMRVHPVLGVVFD
jgi:hypothetical protein